MGYTTAIHCGLQISDCGLYEVLLTAYCVRVGVEVDVMARNLVVG
jgi:hypothetical protein